MDNLPPPIQVTTGGGSGSDKKDDDDDSLIKGEIKFKNPLFKFFSWLKSLIKNEGIKINIKPLTAMGIVFMLVYGAGVGTGYGFGFNAALSKFFPDSSPILHRAILVEGIIQKSPSTKFYLKSEGNLWTLKTVNKSFNLADYLNQQVTIKGNLTKEKGMIEVSEIIPVNITTAPTLIASPIPAPPRTDSNPSDPTELPALYSGLSWEETQTKLLIFTSGKRKIEEEGVYLESAQITDFPQDFINYYMNGLKANGFKQTLNSINPDGITITYATGDLFLTFGTKNVYKGSGDKKQLTGYKAFIEHN